MLLVCTRMLFVFTCMYSYVLVCTRMYSYVKGMYSYVTRMYSYATRMCSYVTRINSCGVLVWWSRSHNYNIHANSDLVCSWETTLQRVITRL